MAELGVHVHVPCTCSRCANSFVHGQDAVTKLKGKVDEC